jgi:truncated hemoglobin YjbI
MTLYDNLGGECLGRLVDSFYEQVLADPVLSLHYQDYDLAKVNKGQRTFLKMVLIRPI